MSKPIALIVEDQASLVQLYEDTLRLIGYDTVSVRDGLAGINRLEAFAAPNLVILDVNMPHLSGRDVHQYLRIRKAEKFADTSVVILTANSLMANRMKPELTKGDYLFIKPITMKDLQTLARSLRPSKDGRPDYQSKTEPIPYLLGPDDALVDSRDKQVTPPNILKPDDESIETSEHPAAVDKTRTQEHRIILTPDDLLIEIDANTQPDPSPKKSASANAVSKSQKDKES